jgi:hypothetical protein
MTEGTKHTKESNCATCRRSIRYYPEAGWVHWAWAAADHMASPMAVNTVLQSETEHLTAKFLKPSSKMSGKKFSDWVMTLPDEDQEIVLLFATNLFCAESIEDGSIAELRSYIREIYESRFTTDPSIWSRFVKDMEDAAK